MKTCPQELHLINQNLPARQIQEFMGVWRIRHGQQFHAGLLRRPGSLVMVAPLAGGNHIGPCVLPTFGYRNDMIAGQVVMAEFPSAIQTQVPIPTKQGSVGERWRMPLCPWRAAHRNDRMDIHVRLCRPVNRLRPPWSTRNGSPTVQAINPLA